jgi:hypothetical protein
MVKLVALGSWTPKERGRNTNRIEIEGWLLDYVRGYSRGCLCAWLLVNEGSDILRSL